MRFLSRPLITLGASAAAAALFLAACSVEVSEPPIDGGIIAPEDSGDVGGADDDADTNNAPDAADEGESSQASGTVTLGGEPLDIEKIDCFFFKLDDAWRISVDLANGDLLLQESGPSGTLYMDGEEWSSLSWGDDEPTASVSEQGAQGELTMYVSGTVDDEGAYQPLAVDISCA